MSDILIFHIHVNEAIHTVLCNLVKFVNSVSLQALTKLCIQILRKISQQISVKLLRSRASL